MKRFGRWALAACIALPLCCPAQGMAEPEVAELEQSATCPDVRYSLIDLLDPERPLEAKTIDARTVGVLAAQPGCTYEQYILGSLHRLGPDLPNNPFPKDVAKAEALLESYGLAGNTVAFADLAEIALASGRARVPRDQIAADLRGYLARNPGLMEKVAMARSRTHDACRGIRTAQGVELRRKDPERQLRTARTYAPGDAVFLLEIQPDGVVSRIVPETFAPNYETGAALRGLMRSMAFEPFAAREPIVARVPVEYGFDKGGPTLRD